MRFDDVDNFSSNTKNSLHHECAKVTVSDIHINFCAKCIGPRVGSYCDDVSSIQLENPTSVHATTEVCLTYLRLKQGNGAVVNVDMDSGIVGQVQLSVDVVLSSGRHRQFSVLVPHTAPKIAVRREGRPVRDHYKKKLIK